MADGDLTTLGAAELSLSDYLSIMFRQRWILLGGLLATLVAAGLWTILTPAQYESTSSVVLRTSFNQSVFPSVGATQNQQFLRQPAAELEYANSTAFAAIANEGLPASVHVSPRYDNDAENRSSQLEFVAVSTDPLEAQIGANQWAMAYLNRRAQGVANDIDATIAGIEVQVDDLEAQKREILEPLAPIEQALLTETDSDTISRLTTQRLSLRESLSDDLLPVELQLRTLVTDLSKMRIAAGFAVDPEISARLSIEPGVGRQIAPNVAQNMSLAAVLGLLLGFGAALLSESFRSVVNSAADLQSIAPSIDVLAELPEFPKDTGNPLALANQVGSPYAESLERIVNVLLYARVQNPQKRLRVVISSALPSEGKTTVATHVAMRLGFTNADTVLIDADLRRPAVHKAMQLDRGQRLGLNRLLHESRPLAPELIPLAGTTVRVLAAGLATNDAAALLRESFGPAIDAMPADYDIMLIDAPPVLVVTDAEVLAESADGMILVVRAGETAKAKLAETVRRISSSGTPLLGFVLVAADARSFGRTYSYDYHAPDAPMTPAPAPARAMTSTDRPAGEPTAPSVSVNGSDGHGTQPPALVPEWSGASTTSAASTSNSAAEWSGIRVLHADREALIVTDDALPLSELAAAFASAMPTANVAVGVMRIGEGAGMVWCDPQQRDEDPFAPDLIVNIDSAGRDTKPRSVHPGAITTRLVRSVDSLDPHGLFAVGSLAARPAGFQLSLSAEIDQTAEALGDLFDQPVSAPRRVRRLPLKVRGSEVGHGALVQAIQVDDRVVLYNSDRHAVSLLGIAASNWWSAIDGETPPTKIDPSMSPEKVKQLVDRLVAKGFLELPEAGRAFSGGI